MAELVLPKNSRIKEGKHYPLDKSVKNKKTFKIAINIRSKTVKNQKKGGV